MGVVLRAQGEHGSSCSGETVAWWSNGIALQIAFSIPRITFGWGASEQNTLSRCIPKPPLHRTSFNSRSAVSVRYNITTMSDRWNPSCERHMSWVYAEGEPVDHILMRALILDRLRIDFIIKDVIFVHQVKYPKVTGVLRKVSGGSST